MITNDFVELFICMQFNEKSSMYEQGGIGLIVKLIL